MKRIETLPVERLEMYSRGSHLTSAGNFEEVHKKSLISVTEKMNRPPVAMSMGDIYRGQERYDLSIMSYGDYSCIVGPSKSRKSFLKSAFLAGYIGGQSIDYFPTLKGHNPDRKVVIDVDTEQSKWDAQFAFKRVHKMVGEVYPEYVGVSTRHLLPKDRLAYIDWLIMDKYKGRVGMVAIDGLADLVVDFNNLVESNELNHKLLTWTAEANCHIITILHKNFGTDKPVGHIGSAMLKKAETVFDLDRDQGEDEYTNVKGKYTRGAKFDDFSFYVDRGDWLPYMRE